MNGGFFFFHRRNGKFLKSRISDVFFRTLSLLIIWNPRRMNILPRRSVNNICIQNTGLFSRAIAIVTSSRKHMHITHTSTIRIGKSVFWRKSMAISHRIIHFQLNIFWQLSVESEHNGFDVFLVYSCPPAQKNLQLRQCVLYQLWAHSRITHHT